MLGAQREGVGLSREIDRPAHSLTPAFGRRPDEFATRRKSAFDISAPPAGTSSNRTPSKEHARGLDEDDHHDEARGKAEDQVDLRQVELQRRRHSGALFGCRRSPAGPEVNVLPAWINALRPHSFTGIGDPASSVRSSALCLQFRLERMLTVWFRMRIFLLGQHKDRAVELARAALESNRRRSMSLLLFQ